MAEQPNGAIPTAQRHNDPTEIPAAQRLNGPTVKSQRRNNSATAQPIKDEIPTAQRRYGPTLKPQQRYDSFEFTMRLLSRWDFAFEPLAFQIQ